MLRFIGDIFILIVFATFAGLYADLSDDLLDSEQAIATMFLILLIAPEMWFIALGFIKRRKIH